MSSKQSALQQFNASDRARVLAYVSQHWPETKRSGGLFTKSKQIKVTLQILRPQPSVGVVSTAQLARNAIKVAETNIAVDNDTTTVLQLFAKLADSFSAEQKNAIKRLIKSSSLSGVMAALAKQNRLDIGKPDLFSVVAGFGDFNAESFSDSKLKKTLKQIGWDQDKTLRLLLRNNPEYNRA